jgi:hypothetical protein
MTSDESLAMLDPSPLCSVNDISILSKKSCSKRLEEKSGGEDC